MQSPTDRKLFDVTGWDSKLIAVGSSTALESDGNTWQPMAGDLNGVILRRVWGAEPDNVFAVGDQGALYHYDGAAWVPMDSGVRAPLTDIWGSAADNIFAVGAEAAFHGPTRYEAGTILHFDGSAWTRMPTRYIRSLSAIWGTSPPNVFALSRGDLARFDGQVWSHMPAPLDVSALIDLHGVPGGSIFMIDGSKILRYSPGE